MHPDESVLRAYIDDENSNGDLIQHIKQCAECQGVMKAMKERADRIALQLDTLAANEPVPSVTAAMTRFQQQTKKTKTGFRFRPAWAAVVALLACGIALSFGPVRVWAQEFLLLFRAQQISVIPIDPANLERLNRDFMGPQNRPDLERFFSDNVHVIEHGKAQNAFIVPDAAAKSGFGLRFPTALPAPSRFHIQPSRDISFTIDLNRILAILHEAGRNDIQLSPQIDGKTVSANISPVAAAYFGTCPDWSDKDSHYNRADYPDCKVLVQTLVPVITAPSEFNPKELGQAMLQLLGTPRDQAKTISENINWATTFVLPVPADERMKYSDVEVDSVKGVLMIREDRHAFNLMWLRNGILYNLMGLGTADEATAIANSMN